MLILPRRYMGPNRPQGPFCLNRGSLQAQGLVAWFPDFLSRKDFAAKELYDLAVLNGTGLTLVPHANFGLAGRFDGATDLASVGCPVANVPITMMAWAINESDSASSNVFVLQPASGSVDRFALSMSGATAGDPLSAISTYSGGSGIARTTTGYVAGKMHLLTGVFASAASRTAYLDGGGSVSEYTSISVNTLGIIRVAARYDASDVAQGRLTGSVADARVYNRALSPAEVWHQYDPATRWDLYYITGRKTTFDMGAAPPAQTISATLVELEVEVFDAAALAPATIAATLVEAEVEAFAASVLAPAVIAAGLAEAEIEVFDAALLAPATISASLTEIEAEVLDALVVSPASIAAGLAELELEAFDAQILAPAVIAATLTECEIETFDATLIVAPANQVISADLLELELEALDAQLLSNLIVTADLSELEVEVFDGVVVLVNPTVLAPSERAVAGVLPTKSSTGVLPTKSSSTSRQSRGGGGRYRS